MLSLNPLTIMFRTLFLLTIIIILEILESEAKALFIYVKKIFVSMLMIIL